MIKLVYMVKFGQEKKFFIILFLLSFTIFALTSDGHRFTFDEDVTQQQSLWIATMTPDPRFIPGESRLLFQYPDYFPGNERSLCNSAILCSQVTIGSALTQVPFILLNHTFDFVTSSTLVLTNDDFPDPHYVFWRNSIEPDFIFMELFYGPFFSALSVGMFYLVSRTYGFSTKISIFLTILFGITTPIWAYSQTSLNIVPITFFILFGFFFFRKFIITTSSRYIVLSGIVLGFAFLIRNDAILFIIPLFFFFIFMSLKNSNKIKNSKRIQNFLLFTLPMIFSYFIHVQIGLVKGLLPHDAVSFPTSFLRQASLMYLNMFGMLFSPGVGLLIFSPILFTIFLSYFDFFKKNKIECLLFVSFLVGFLVFFGLSSETWHGLNGWAERYLTSVTPFLLLPLGFSIQKRLNKKFYSILIGLGSLGFIFNIFYLVTDVSWFIWGVMGSGRGLYELGHIAQHLWIHPLVIWTFDYSQLTHAAKYAFEYSVTDIFWLNAWGLHFYSIFSIILISSFTYCLIYLNKKSITNVKKLQ